MAQGLFRSHNTFAFGALSSDKISFSARIHIDLEVPRPLLYSDTILSRTTECRPQAQHLIFRGPLWPQGFTSLSCAIPRIHLGLRGLQMRREIIIRRQMEGKRQRRRVPASSCPFPSPGIVPCR